MLWPIVLPFKITLVSLVAIILVATTSARLSKRNAANTFLLAMLIAFLMFVPSCFGIMAVIDAQRFGVFQHEHYSEVEDFRVERYLPTSATEITLEKTAMGHRAKYSITKSELTNYLDSLWESTGNRSPFERKQLADGEAQERESFAFEFQGLDWSLPETATKYESPIQGDGGGATYYFDDRTNTAYQRAGYW